MRSVLFIGILIGFGMVTPPASAQMRPGAGSAIISTQDQQANAEADDRLEHLDLASRNRLDSVDWGRPEWLSEPAPKSNVATEPDDPKPETSVERRAREVRQEANQRWYERRVNADVPLEGYSYPEMSGWFTPSGEPVPERWPWWLW
jgi:hypothetical protein